MVTLWKKIWTKLRGNLEVFLVLVTVVNRGCETSFNTIKQIQSKNSCNSQTSFSDYKNKTNEDIGYIDEPITRWTTMCLDLALTLETWQMWLV